MTSTRPNQLVVSLLPKLFPPSSTLPSLREILLVFSVAQLISINIHIVMVAMTVMMMMIDDDNFNAFHNDYNEV